MSIGKALSTRLRLAARAEMSAGRIYRPVLSSIHFSGARISTSIKPVLDSLGLQSSKAGSTFTPLPLPDGTLRVFPDFYDSGNLTLECIQQILYSTRPECVIETGVANGLSSRTILAALDLNNRGSLYSFDIDSRAANSVPAQLKERWHFRTLDRKRALKQLAQHAEQLTGGVGVWLHDSDQSYSWLRSELNLAQRVLAPGGILIVDDADGTEAFADFCREHPSWTYAALFDTRKVCGFARKPFERSINS